MIPSVKGKLRFTRLDLILLIGLSACFGWLGYRLSLGLNYRWNWGVLPQYFFRYDSTTDSWLPNLLMEGFFTTIRISIWSSLLALLIGVVMGVMTRARGLYPRMLVGVYVELVRNTPPLVLIFIFYFFLGNQLMGLLGVERFIAGQSDTLKGILAIMFSSEAHFSAFLSALLTMAIYEGAYITEITRAGINSVSTGQWEAADSLGLGTWDKYRHVVLPQAFRNMLPALAGQFISTIKDSAIISVISIQELAFQGMELMAATYLTYEIWITITLMYFLLTFFCSYWAGRLERRLSRMR